MTKKRDRFFAGFGAFLFLISAVAVTVVAILSSLGQEDATVADLNNTSCEPSASIAAPAEALPEVFKPEGDVTKLETTDLLAGDGEAVKTGDCLQVKYYGTLAKDGSVFDGNFDKPTAFQFPLGGGQVIQGWEEGLLGAKIGATRRIVIPSELAYGDQANNGIPANSDLVFVVKLIKVTK